MRMENVPDEELRYYVDNKYFQLDVVERIDTKNEYIQKLETIISDIYKDVEIASLWVSDIKDVIDEISVDEDLEKFINNIIGIQNKIDMELSNIISKLDDEQL